MYKLIINLTFLEDWNMYFLWERFIIKKILQISVLYLFIYFCPSELFTCA